jgi:hypothetical protein
VGVDAQPSGGAGRRADAAVVRKTRMSSEFTTAGPMVRVKLAAAGQVSGSFAARQSVCRVQAPGHFVVSGASLAFGVACNEFGRNALSRSARRPTIA